MSTFLEVRHAVHLTKRTTYARLDDDFKVTIREEEEGKNPVHFQRNYSGVEDGEQLDGARIEAPVEYVRVSKLDDDARCVIAVTIYHAEDEQDTVPPAGLYWYNFKTHSAFGVPAPPGLQVAPDPAYPGGATQTFPQVIFNISSATELRDHPIPTTNTVPISYIPHRLYRRLGTLAARRAHLKTLLRGIVQHQDFALWVLNANEEADITQDGMTGSIGTALRNIVNLIARPQSFAIWLEMMANVISIDTNLNSERKFNLLAGELGLGGRAIIEQAQSASFGTAQIASESVRNTVASWKFHKFGDVATGSPWGYTKPTASAWPASEDTTIVLTGAALGDDWLDYVRS